MPSRWKYATIIECEDKMTIPNRRPLARRPIHPGEILREDFLPDYELTGVRLATALGVSRKTVSDLLHERRAVTPEMALRLARLFGNSAEFWLNLQRAVDLWEASGEVQEAVRRIKPLSVA